MSYYVPVTSAAFFSPFICFFFFFFTDTAPPEIYTLSLHDALPISRGRQRRHQLAGARPRRASRHAHRLPAPALPIRGPRGGRGPARESHGDQAVSLLLPRPGAHQPARWGCEGARAPRLPLRGSERGLAGAPAGHPLRDGRDVAALRAARRRPAPGGGRGGARAPAARAAHHPGLPGTGRRPIRPTIPGRAVLGAARAITPSRAVPRPRPLREPLEGLPRRWRLVGDGPAGRDPERPGSRPAGAGPRRFGPSRVARGTPEPGTPPDRDGGGAYRGTAPSRVRATPDRDGRGVGVGSGTATVRFRAPARGGSPRGAPAHSPRRSVRSGGEGLGDHRARLRPLSLGGGVRVGAIEESGDDRLPHGGRAGGRAMIVVVEVAQALIQHRSQVQVLHAERVGHLDHPGIYEAQQAVEDVETVIDADRFLPGLADTAVPEARQLLLRVVFLEPRLA